MSCPSGARDPFGVRIEGVQGFFGAGWAAAWVPRVEHRTEGAGYSLPRRAYRRDDVPQGAPQGGDEPPGAARWRSEVGEPARGLVGRELLPAAGSLASGSVEVRAATLAVGGARGSAGAVVRVDASQLQRDDL